MNFAIIVAAGSGKRMGENINKVFLPILGKPIVYYALNTFQDCSEINEIIIVAQKNYFSKINEIKKQYGFNKIKNIVEGGKERQDSVYNGLMSISNAKNDDVVIVHNGSNPLVRENEIAECISSAKKFGAAACCFPLKDTIKKIKNDFIEKTIGRKNVYQMQTPQAVKYGLFMEGFKNIKKNKLKVTDDVSAIESLGKSAKIVQCSYENIKITTKDDLAIAEGILMKRHGVSNFRIGFGQDSHQFSGNKSKKLVLGGYIIPNEKGLEADSDGDVILHALFNALSSAIGGRSLDYYAGPMCRRGITDSKEYLKIILRKLDEKSFRIGNISVSIEAARPKLEQHTDKIKNSLSGLLGLEEEKIGITYTSGDKLTSFGKGEGMQCFAVVIIQ
ncbi:2-C-methyl-D-erythritol 4-phosphate cytidylyltransferase [Candidatus Woesearchaeota archaeon]|nr:2-C-methyl-D-erythritol 4-phosphate cytidylyltransferase [Candidatus Woesearchaeota archaeon]